MVIEPKIGHSYYWRNPGNGAIATNTTYTVVKVNEAADKVLLKWDDGQSSVWYEMKYFREGYMYPVIVEAINE